MNYLKSETKLSNLQLANSDSMSPEQLHVCKLKHQLAQMAKPLAEIWRDNHHNTQSSSNVNLVTCTLNVATEISIAADLVGEHTGTIIAAGGGLAAASAACRQVLHHPSDDN
ncbi:MAG: hypothetical protein F6K16_10875 [Symploca sp. SIO2B6]|nr:hypothetical protein [Symploca sp. SIO2B6]